MLALLTFVLFVEFGSTSIRQEVPDEFEDFLNAIEQRNQWVEGYWFDLRWKSRTFVNFTTGPIVSANLEVDTGIPATGLDGDCGFIRLFNRTNEGKLTAVTFTSVSSTTPPCTVTFNYFFGSAYEIYWNTTVSPGGAPNIGTGNLQSPQIKRIEQRPLEGICSQLPNRLQKHGINLTCSGTPLQNSYNYSVSYKEKDFGFAGNIS